MQKLQFPAGTTSVSAQGKQYDCDENGVVEVDDDAVLALVEIGAVGYVAAKTIRKAKADAAADAAATAAAVAATAAAEAAAAAEQPETPA